MCIYKNRSRKTRLRLTLFWMCIYKNYSRTTRLRLTPWRWARIRVSSAWWACWPGSWRWRWWWTAAVGRARRPPASASTCTSSAWSAGTARGARRGPPRAASPATQTRLARLPPAVKIQACCPGHTLSYLGSLSGTADKILNTGER